MCELFTNWDFAGRAWRGIKIFFEVLLLIGIVVFVIMVVGEASMRIVGNVKNIDYRLYMKELTNTDRHPEGLFIGDPIVGHALNPNVQLLASTSDFSTIYTVNSNGLRDREYDVSNSQGKTRIAAFGDSITFGEGIPYALRFTDIIEENVPNIEMINFGVPGYGLDNILLSILTKGVKYSPQYVMVFLNAPLMRRYSQGLIEDGVVVLDEAMIDEQSGGELTAYIPRGDTFYKDTTHSIMKHSYFLSFLNYHYSLLKLKKKMEEFDKNYWEQIFDEIESGEDSSSATSIIKNRGALLIGAINDVCKDHGIRLILVQIDGQIDFQYLGENDDNIIFYSLVDELRDRGEKTSLSFKYDPHYNRETNRFIAERVTTFLTEVL